MKASPGEPIRGRPRLVDRDRVLTSSSRPKERTMPAKSRGDLLAVVAACACLVVIDPDRPAAAPAPLPRTPRTQPRNELSGTWRVVEVHANGKHRWYEVSEGQVWVITRDRITIRYRDWQAEEF